MPHITLFPPLLLHVFQSNLQELIDGMASMFPRHVLVVADMGKLPDLVQFAIIRMSHIVAGMARMHSIGLISHVIYSSSNKDNKSDELE
jgi:hypothetical protein